MCLSYSHMLRSGVTCLPAALVLSVSVSVQRCVNATNMILAVLKRACLLASGTVESAVTGAAIFQFTSDHPDEKTLAALLPEQMARRRHRSEKSSASKNQKNIPDKDELPNSPPHPPSTPVLPVEETHVSQRKQTQSVSL